MPQSPQFVFYSFQKQAPHVNIIAIASLQTQTLFDVTLGSVQFIDFSGESAFERLEDNKNAIGYFASIPNNLIIIVSQCQMNFRN